MHRLLLETACCLQSLLWSARLFLWAEVLHGHSYSLEDTVLCQARCNLLN